MCQIVLRGLLLPDNKYQTNSTGNVSTKNSPAQDSNVEESTQKASTLTKLDSLKLSGASSGSSKGSVPIQLLSPNEMSGTESVKPKRQGNRLAALSLLDGNKPSNRLPAAQPKPKTKLYSLADLESASPSGSTQGVKQTAQKPATRPAGVSINSVNFVEGADKTTEKLGLAIEKIKIWDRKVGALSSELQKQQELKQNSGNIDPAKLMSRSKQVKEARTAAVLARDEAIKAYTAALEEIKSQFGDPGINSGSARQYKTDYDKMEKMFAATDAKDASTMGQVLEFFKNSMTKENFSLALSYLNPFSSNPNP